MPILLFVFRVGCELLGWLVGLRVLVVVGEKLVLVWFLRHLVLLVWLFRYLIWIFLYRHLVLVFFYHLVIFYLHHPIFFYHPPLVSYSLPLSFSHLLFSFYHPQLTTSSRQQASKDVPSLPNLVFQPPLFLTFPFPIIIFTFPTSLLSLIVML